MNRYSLLVFLFLSIGASVSCFSQNVVAEDEEFVNDSLLNALDSIVNLQNITVTAQRQLIKTEIDRVSYDVQNDGDSKTLTTLDMLRKVPMVSIDGEENIRVNGQSNYKIYKNGHPDPALSGRNVKDVLRAIPASMIKRIEVITDPGAKYDAEGTTAILNIVMLDGGGTKGVAGTVYAHTNHRFDPGLGGFLTSQLNKVTATVNYGFARDVHSMRQHSQSHSRYGNSGNELNDYSEGNAKPTVHYGNLEASWEPDTLNLLTASFGGYYYNVKSWGAGHTQMNDATGSTIYSYGTNNHSPKSDYFNINGRADYEHSTHLKGEKLTLSYMLSATHNTARNASEFVDLVNFPVTYTGTDQNRREDFWEHTFQFDWVRPFAKYYKFETGLKYIHRLNKSHTLMNYAGGDEVDVDSRFNHLTQVAAAYLSLDYIKGNWSTRAGIRYEYSYMHAKFPDGSQLPYHRSLSDWAPNMSVKYQFNMFNSLKFSFSTSINRPGIEYLNPALLKSPTTVSQGDSRLGSADYYNFNLSFMHVGAKFTFNISPSFLIGDDAITQVKWVDANDVEHTTFANGLKSRALSMTGFAQWQITPKTNFMLNCNGGYSYYHSDSQNLTNHRWSFGFFTNLDQQLPWRLRVSGYAGKWGGEADGLYGYQGTIWFYGLSLQRSFLAEDRLTVRAGVSNFVNGKYGSMTNYVTKGDLTGWSKTEILGLGRSLNISVSYRFGSLKASVKKTETTIENNDVVGGTSNPSQGTGQQQGQPQK